MNTDVENLQIVQICACILGSKLYQIVSILSNSHCNLPKATREEITNNTCANCCGSKCCLCLKFCSYDVGKPLLRTYKALLRPIYWQLLTTGMKAPWKSNEPMFLGKAYWYHITVKGYTKKESDLRFSFSFEKSKWILANLCSGQATLSYCQVLTTKMKAPPWPLINQWQSQRLGTFQKLFWSGQTQRAKTFNQGFEIGSVFPPTSVPSIRLRVI